MRSIKFIRVMIALMMLFTASFVANAYDFSATNSDGVTIYYAIISDTDHLVAVTAKDTNYNCYSGRVVIPAYVKYNDEIYKVTRIGHKAMRNCPNLKEVVLPVTVKYIGQKAFKNDDNITITMSVDTQIEGGYIFDAENVEIIKY